MRTGISSVRPKVVRTWSTRLLTALQIVTFLPVRPRLCRDRASRGGTYWKLRYLLPGEGPTPERRRSLYLGHLDENQVCAVEQRIDQAWPPTKHEDDSGTGVTG